MKDPKKNPDHLLFETTDGLLNQSFYSSTPSEYLLQRLENVMLVAAKPDRLQALVNEGFSYLSLKVAPQTPTSERLEEDMKVRERFVYSECVVLLHHAAETLLRAYFAHAPRTASPWLEMARERTPSGFKKKVAERFDGAPRDEQRTEELCVVFRGTAKPESLKPAPDRGVWDASLDNIEAFMTHFARLFLNDAPEYNAAKHGLAVHSGTPSMKLGDGDLIQKEGPALDFLEVKPTDDGLRWHWSTHWLDPDRYMGLVMIACRFIDQIWAVGAHRYLRKVPAEYSLLEGPKFEDFMKRESGIHIDRMSMALNYWKSEEMRDKALARRGTVLEPSGDEAPRNEGDEDAGSQGERTLL